MKNAGWVFGGFQTRSERCRFGTEAVRVGRARVRNLRVRGESGKNFSNSCRCGGVKFCGCEAGADKRFQLAQHCKVIQAQLYVPLDVLSLIRNDCREPHVIDRLLSVDQWAIIVHCGTQSQTTLLLQSSASKYVIFICLVHSETSWKNCFTWKVVQRVVRLLIVYIQGPRLFSWIFANEPTAIDGTTVPNAYLTVTIQIICLHKGDAVKSTSNFLIWLIDSTASPLRGLFIWKQIRASLNRRRVMKAEPSRLIPPKLAANPEL